LLNTDLFYVATNLVPVLPNLTKKRVFLTGGTGFVGTWLTETFAVMNRTMELEAELVALTRKDMLSTDPAVKFVRGDVRDFEFPEGKFEYVIHAAADYRAEPKEVFSINVDGTKRVLEFAKEKGVKRMVFTSSGAVYRANLMKYMDPRMAYGESKRTAEMMCVLSDVETRIARLWGFVGPCMPLDGPWAITKFIKEGLAGGPVKVSGGANVTRSYLYASEMIQGLWGMLLWDKANPVYNIGSSEPITIGALALLVASVCGCKIEATPGDYPDDVYVPPPGPKPNIGLREAIERTVAWHKEQK